MEQEIGKPGVNSAVALVLSHVTQIHNPVHARDQSVEETAGDKKITCGRAFISTQSPPSYSWYSPWLEVRVAMM